MKIRRASNGSLNFHVNKIFKLSVMNLDHMIEVGLQKKKRRKFLPFYPPTQSHILDETWNKQVFLAHLSRRLTRWAYSIPMVHHLSSSVVVHTFKLEYLWSQFANLDQILCVASLGWGKGCIRFWDRLDQNSGYHGNRKPPLIYNGENDVSTFFQLFLIQSFSYLQVTRTCIKSRMSSNFSQIGPQTMELAALECLKNFP